MKLVFYFTKYRRILYYVVLVLEQTTLTYYCLLFKCSINSTYYEIIELKYNTFYIKHFINQS